MTPSHLATLAAIHALASQAPSRTGYAVHVTVMHAPEGYHFITVDAFAQPSAVDASPALKLSAAILPDGRESCTSLLNRPDLPLVEVQHRLAEFLALPGPAL